MLLLAQFIDLSPQEMSSRTLYDTKNSYEFVMLAIHVGDNWYVLVENPDDSRLQDIHTVISEEFDARTVNWCVLKGFQEEFGATLPYGQAIKNRNKIVYEDGTAAYWLLKIMPNRSSRLLVEDGLIPTPPNSKPNEEQS